MSIDEIITAYIEAKETEAAAKKRAASMKALIIEFAAGAETFETDVFTVIMKKTTSVRLDTAALYRDFPDVKSVYEKRTESVTVVPARKPETAAKSA